MRNNLVRRTFAPRADNWSCSVPSCFYRLHEGTGSACADALGNGGDLTLAASGTATPWANRPWITFDGTNHYVQKGSDSYLRTIFRLDQAYQQIFQGIDFYWDGGATGPEALIFIGTSDNLVGGWGVTINSSSQVVLTTRGVGASNHTDSPFTGYSMAASSNVRISLLVELRYASATTADAVLYANGASVSSLTGVNLVANSATAVFGSVETSGSQAYTLGAQPSGTSSRARLLNSAASNGRLSRWWASRHTTLDTALGLALAKDLYRYPGELPRCMNGL